MGRILRVGTDTVTNYTFLQTSAYDENAPAATTSPWPDSASMDQLFNQPNPTGVVAQGVLITFARFPDTFLGVMVKVEPTYDSGAGEHPFLEMWTHDSVTTLWTRRRRIDLLNLFVGIPSGTRKVADLTFFPFLRTVDKVWVTMDPGVVGAPTMEFFSIQLFGQCEQSLRRDTNNGPPGGGPEPTFGPPTEDPLPPIDICNVTSIEQYRDALRNIPGALEQFDAWYDSNAETIASLCAGIDANPPNTPVLPPMPVPPLPPLPELDLCSQDSIDAFRAALAGDADALANFDAFITQLETDGFFEANCATPPPDETYVDPNTLEPTPEPDTDNNTPFGAGPGGQPQFPRASDRPGNGSGEPTEFATTVSRYLFFFFSNGEKDEFVTALGSESAEIQTAWADVRKTVVIFGNGEFDPPIQSAINTITFTVNGVSRDDIVQIISLRASSHFLAYQDSIPPIFRVWNGDKVSASINATNIVDWLITRGSRLAGIPGSSVENGGQAGSTVAQSKGVVVGTGEDGAVTLTLTSAFDPTAHAIFGSPSASDEATHGTIHKHIANGFDPDPPFDPITVCRHRLLFFRFDITKRIASFDEDSGANSVFITSTHTTVTS